MSAYQGGGAPTVPSIDVHSLHVIEHRIRVGVARAYRTVGIQRADQDIVATRGNARATWQASAAMLDALLDFSRIEAGVLVACRQRGDAVRLEVWDTGIGIDEFQQNDIFLEFHQLGNPERDRRKGLGLGLPIAQGLARALKHNLALTSRPARPAIS